MIPEFSSLDEEKKYWEERGPLGRGPKHSCFLTIRLTSGELDSIRSAAARRGLGPSTFARLVLTKRVRWRG